MEVRFVRGSFSRAWAGDRVVPAAGPARGGEEPSPRQRLAAAADFPNGIATELAWDRWVFINPDLTMYVEREPVGEWICLDASMRVVERRLGLSEAVLYDERRSRRALAANALRGAAATTSDYFRRKALIRTSYCCASRL
jgi:hypothetical protein